MTDQTIESNHAWKPTEEELVSLGFTRNSTINLWRTLGNPQVFFDKRKGLFEIYRDAEDFTEEDQCIQIYPKSIEELRLLLSMMNP